LKVPQNIYQQNKKNKQKNTSQAKLFQNPIEKGQINIPANIHMTSHFPVLVQVLK
jgi:hypothetical protein